MHNPKTAITICGHGTKSADGLTSFFKLYHALKDDLENRGFAVNYGFIEMSEPLLEAAITEHLEKGITTVIIMPLLLFHGVHTQHDIPFVAHKIYETHGHVTLKLSEPLGLSQTLADICLKNLETTLTDQYPLDKTELLVIGVGSSKPEANIHIATLTRALWENMPFSFASYAFISKMAFPDIETALERLQKSGAEHIVILPVLLFPGVYMNGIVLKTEWFKKTFGGRLLTCPTLDHSELIKQAFLERLNQALTNPGAIISAENSINKPRKL